MPTFDNDTSYSSIVIDSVISAITLVIALAWNKAIKELIVKITYLNRICQPNNAIQNYLRLIAILNRLCHQKQNHKCLVE